MRGGWQFVKSTVGIAIQMYGASTEDICMNEMAVWLVPISVALIGGPVMWFLSRFDKRNTEQHGQNLKALDRIEQKVDGVREDLSDHIQWHLKKPSD